jgi:hypothetical protein
VQHTRTEKQQNKKKQNTQHRDITQPSDSIHPSIHPSTHVSYQSTYRLMYLDLPHDGEHQLVVAAQPAARGLHQHQTQRAQAQAGSVGLRGGRHRELSAGHRRGAQLHLQRGYFVLEHLLLVAQL